MTIFAPTDRTLDEERQAGMIHQEHATADQVKRDATLDLCALMRPRNRKGSLVK